jgi:Cu/Ag efflux protein CusF
MTRIARLVAVFALSAFAALADDKKPTIDVSHEITFTSTVKSVDQKTRKVTLTGSAGEEVSFTANKKIKNLGQLKVGDQVTATLVESLKARVLKPGEKLPEGSSTTNLATAPVGAKPAGTASANVHIVATVVAIDVPNMFVTLKDAKDPKADTFPVKAMSKANIEKLKVGDNIEIKASRSLTVNAITPPAAPK